MATKRQFRDAGTVMTRMIGPLTFRRALRAHRLCEEMTQAELAKRLGVSKQHLSDIETGRKLVSPERAYVWAKKLGVVELQWAQLAIQDALDKAHIPVRVRLERAA